MKVPWQIALGAVFWAGVVFLLLSVFNIRTHIVRAIPPTLRYAITAGIGLFIALIGLVNAGFIVHHPATVIGMAKLDPPLLVFLFGLFLTAFFIARKVTGAVLFGMAATTLLAYTLGRLWGGNTPLVTWQGFLAAPDFSLLFSLDLVHSFS